MKKLYPKFCLAILAVLYSLFSFAQVSVTATAGTTGPTSYTTLKAAFDAINAGTHQGSITIGLSASTTETASAVLNGSGTGSASYTAIVIKPTASSTPTISGSIATPLIDLVGANNVVLDGSNTAGGTTKNLTISNTNISGATISLSNGASNNTIKNAVLQGVSTSTANAVLLVGTSTAATGNNNNVIQNNDITKGATSPRACIYNTGTSGKANTGNIYRGNRLMDFGQYGYQDGNGTNGFSSNALVEGNEIFQNAAQTTVITGIILNQVAGIVGTTISKNNIHDMLSTIAGNVVGIDLFDAVSVTIVNNMISLNNATSTSLRGIAQETDAGAVIKVYYNTVSISGTTSAGSSFAFLKDYLSTGDDIRNNIFSNTRLSSGTGKQYAIVNSSTGTFVSNFNDLVSVGNALNFVGLVGATDYATLGDWRTGTSQDANSVSINPVFVSAINLHLVPASNGLLDNKGTPITGITTDYDGDTRSATTPDLGLDEFTGSTAVANDIQATAFISPLNASTVPANLAFAPQASFTNNGTSTQTNVQVRYKIINASSTVVYNQTATIASITSGQVITVTFPNATIAAAGAYTIQAIAELTGDQTTANDQISGTITASAQMCGTYHVGTAQPAPFNTLTAAINQLKAVGVSCAVTLLLDDASYSTNETFPIIITAIPGASATNTITIKPNTGVSPTIASTAATTFTLSGADFIIFDGSNAATGTTKDLTITNSGTSGVVIWIASASTTDGSNNNTVKNTIISGTSSTTTIGGILSGSGVTLGGDAESPNSNNTIQNNTIIKVQNGLYLRGGVTNFDQNWVVSNNILGSAVAAEKLSFRGLLIGQAQNFVISGNTITGVVSSTTSTSVMNGIQLALAVSGGTISNNKISDVKQLNTTGFGAFGISLGASSTTSAVNIFNNFISDVAATGNTTTVTSNGFGIGVLAGGGYNIYYNTVNMTAAQTTGTTAAIVIASAITTAGAIDIRNNIFVNPQTTATSFAIHSAAANTVFSNINYNDYAVGAGGSLGFIGSNRATLADIQAGFGGNANSKNVQPVFVSATDLHLAATGNTALQAGTPIAGITTDIDGDTRGGTPYMGADEISTTCVAPAITTQPIAQAACTGSGATFTVVATGTGLTYQWRKASANITGATSASYTIAAVVAGDAANYDVVITNGCGNVTSAAVALTVNAAPSITTQPTNQTVCSGANATFTVVASGTPTYQWKLNGTNITGATNASYTVAASGTTTGSYTVTISNGTCSVTSSAATLALSTATSITTQPTAALSVCTGAAANFTVVGAGTGTLTYQWRKNTVNITGATSAAYTIAAVAAGDAGSYDVVVTGTCGPVTSAASVLTVTTCTAIQPVNSDVSSVVLMPSVVRSTTVMRVVVTRSMKIDWTVVDAQGKVVLTFSKSLTPGQNDIEVQAAKLSAGVYQISGSNEKGKTQLVRFIKL
jgi:hypothetical protein